MFNFVVSVGQRKKSEFARGFELMTSQIPIRGRSNHYIFSFLFLARHLEK